MLPFKNQPFPQGLKKEGPLERMEVEVTPRTLQGPESQIPSLSLSFPFFAMVFQGKPQGRHLFWGCLVLSPIQMIVALFVVLASHYRLRIMTLGLGSPWSNADHQRKHGGFFIGGCQHGPLGRAKDAYLLAWGRFVWNCNGVTGCQRVRAPKPGYSKLNSWQPR